MIALNESKLFQALKLEFIPKQNSESFCNGLVRLESEYIFKKFKIKCVFVEVSHLDNKKGFKMTDIEKMGI